MSGFKSNFVCALVILSGLIIGSFIGSITEAIGPLSWLNYGKTIGLTSPLTLDLAFLYLQFAIKISFTIAGILGMLIAGIIYKITLK